MHLPVVNARSSIRNDGSRAYVHPADVHGRFAKARKVTFVLLMAVYALLPWVKVGGHPAVFLDVEHRSFYLLGATFNAQDVWMSVFLITGLFFGLVYLTALAGRVWCGWACPQTVFLEGVFRPIERFIEGPREKRIRRNAGPWTFDKAWRKTVVNILFFGCAFVIAHMFLAYFVSIPALFRAMRESPAAHPEAFAVVIFLTAILFFDFAWFREQFCVVLCPYGRLQSALLDPDSLVVGYDVLRGEPRGKVKKTAVESSSGGGAAASSPSGSTKQGDCVDCGRCVNVCPTGIDIRNGLQMDCIGCTACIDACDDIMDKLGRPRGLVRYDSERGFLGEKRRILRPRLFLYTALGAVGLVVTTISYARRQDFEANVLRVQGVPYTLENGAIRNAFTVHIVNKKTGSTRFRVEPEAAGLAKSDFLVPMPEVELGSLSQATVPIFVSAPESTCTGEFLVNIRIIPVGDERDGRVVTAPFLGPKR